MHKIIPLISLFIIIAATSCKNKKEKPVSKKDSKAAAWSDLPEAVSLDSFRQTDFVPTLENPFNPERNTVYAAALLYAWDTITKLLPGAIVDADSYSNDFNLLRYSRSFENSLTSDEYSIKAEVDGKAIIAEAFFNKTLPFPVKMKKAEEPMLFDGKKVNAFGMYHLYDKITAYSKILFYDNDDRFLLKFSSQEKEHELWLMKSADTDSTLGHVLKRAKEWKVAGEKEAGNEKLAWKYTFNEEDVFSIPEIKFNIYTHYKALEGQPFYVKGEERVIETAYQRTGFKLNETGAVAESEALMRTDTMSISLEKKILPKPKKMVFDKPFYIILKRTDSENPYFVMRVANAELLVKQ